MNAPSEGREDTVLYLREGLPFLLGTGGKGGQGPWSQDSASRGSASGNPEQGPALRGGESVCVHPDIPSTLGWGMSPASVT